MTLLCFLSLVFVIVGAVFIDTPDAIAETNVDGVLAAGKVLLSIGLIAVLFIVVAIVALVAKMCCCDN
jgi:hypothetical protein